MAQPYLFGAGALLLFWIVSGVITGQAAPWALAVTESKVQGQRQKELSASKLQALVWTLVTMFAYASVFGALWLEAESGAHIPDLPEIPLNLLVLMGLSVTTAAGAKGLTVSYKAQGRISEQSGGAVTDPDGNPQLVKAQMLVWTFLGALWYLLKVVRFIDGVEAVQGLSLPDVDGTLLVLMGAAEGAYIGDKLVSRDILKTPKLEKVEPAEGRRGAKITLVGENFGDAQGGNFVSIDDRVVSADDTISWSNLKIEVNIPAACEAKEVPVKVYRDGEWSGKCSLTVEQAAQSDAGT